MTSEQILLIRSSWPDVEANAEDLTKRFYSRLFEIDVRTAALFKGVDMIAQRRKLAQTLSVVVHALDDPDSLLPALAALGKRHTSYGVAHHHFDIVGNALVSALGETLGGAFTGELREAWVEAYSVVAAVMRRALIRAETAEPATPVSSSQPA